MAKRIQWPTWTWNIPQERVKELMQLSGVDRNTCEMYLKEPEGKVATVMKALKDLVKNGQTEPERLDPKKVPANILQLAKKKQAQHEKWEAQEKAEEEKKRKREEAKRAKAKRVQLEPVGELVWADYCWEGKMLVPGLAGLQGLRTAGGKAAIGKVRVYVKTKDDKSTPPAAEQGEALAYLRAHGKELAKRMLEAIFKKYPGWRKIYGADKEDSLEMPVVKKSEGLMPLVGVHSVHVWHRGKSKQVFVGFEFGCSWDEEHGLGVLTLGEKVVKTGGADTAFHDQS